MYMFIHVGTGYAVRLRLINSLDKKIPIKKPLNQISGLVGISKMFRTLLVHVQLFVAERDVLIFFQLLHN